MSQPEKNEAHKIDAQAEVEDLEVTARESEDVKGGAGKVSMQDFHFVMRNNSASPR